MLRRSRILLFVTLLSCSTEQVPFDLGTYPIMEYPVDNPENSEVAALGEALFFDPILSIDSSISCGSCHKPEYAFADHVAITPGVNGGTSTRNSPTLLNVGFHPYFMREGGVPSLEMQVLVPLQEETEMHHNLVDAVARLNASPYKHQFLQTFGDTVTSFNLVRALANYERTLIDFTRPIDLLQLDLQPISNQAHKGGQLFFGKAGCVQCHNGLLFTDFSFTNNGTPINFTQDIGKERLTNEEDDRYTFMVPSLKHVALTAPYMHDGSISTLQEVIEQYNEGGEGHVYQDARIESLGLSKKECEQLLAFLESL
jgi:cytochrome c peroxidase